MNYRITGNCAVIAMAACLCTPAYAASDDNVGDIVVTGLRDAKEASSGTKSATPIAETPQSI
ncbi:hypothetical protein ABTB42_20510, partial [Acinetobacter baumannii]